MKHLTLGISSCPNDTFIFAALLTGKVDQLCSFDLVMADVEELNQKALKSEIDIVKVSYGVLDKIINDYAVLPAGGALGFGCGPLLVSKEGINLPVAGSQASFGKIAIPGFNTTAFKVFTYFYPHLKDSCVSVRFDKIMPGVASGEFSAGLIIHEGRFIYDKYGLKKLADMGELWQAKFNAPLPLGAIVMRRNMGNLAPVVNRMIVKSIGYAYANEDSIMPFVKKYSDEMDEQVMKSHIGLYVNEYSKDATPAIAGIADFLNVSQDKVFHRV